MSGSRMAIVSVVAVLSLGVLLALAPSVTAEDDEHGARLEKVQKLLKDTKITLVAAVQKAEKSTGGQALGAGLDVEDGKPIWEVVLYVGGDKPQVVEVEIDAKSGEILEDDDEDDDDDEVDDDEDDDDDDDEDEDDEDDDD
jgi:uncharacterized membrane protein YkoI